MGAHLLGKLFGSEAEAIGNGAAVGTDKGEIEEAAGRAELAIAGFVGRIVAEISDGGVSDREGREEDAREQKLPGPVAQREGATSGSGELGVDRGHLGVIQEETT